MQITEIIASYESKQNVGDYSNVMPHLTIKATLGESDDPARAVADLTALVRTAVQRDVDDALEANDRAPVYSTEPRYRVAVRHDKKPDGLPKIALLVPRETPLPPSFTDYNSGFRLPAARRLAAKHRTADAIFVDTTVEPDALAPVLAQVEAEEAMLKAEREREAEERRKRWEAEQQRYGAHDEDDEDE